MVRATPTRWIIAAAAALVSALAPAGVAGADPAGPTDFETIVVSVTPPSEAIDVDVIGGDSFLQLTAEPGTEVIVEGYQQEPYLRFLPDGVVEENRRSPTTYLNASRYGGDDVPAEADATLPPDWQPVGSGGRYAWHDHRIHLMQRGTPAVGAPGDEVQASTVAMNVNGEPVDVAVAVYWLPAPSRVPLAAGAAIGAALVILAVVTRHRLAWPLLAVAVAAAGIGWWQFTSLPSETGPLLVWWLLPAIATVSVVVALALGRRLVASALVLLAALELGAWVVLRREGALRALIPTDAPFWLDRGVMAATVVVAVSAAIGAMLAMFRTPGAAVARS